MKLLEFGRSTILFRIDLDVLPPKTLSHKPPFAMNNARIQIDSVCRITERASGQRPHLRPRRRLQDRARRRRRDLFLDPNADFIPIFSDDGFMHIKTFARAGTQAQAYPPGSGEQSDRLTAPIDETFVDAHLDLVEREGELLADGRAIVEAILANDLIVGIHRLARALRRRDRIPGEDHQRQRARHRLPDRHRADPVARPRPRPGRPAARARARLHGRQRPRLGPDHRSPPDGDRRRRRGLPLRRIRSGWRASPTSSTGSPTPHRRPAAGSTSSRTPRPPKKGPS